nr:protein PFC0760c-like [Aegilops tauschii subsp. strangulata]
MSDEGNEMEAKIRYYGDDGCSEDGSLSLDEDEHDGENYMSLDESYSGNVGGDDDNEDMDVDDSYAESGSHMDVEGYYEWNFFDDANDENDIDASYNDSSTKGEVGGPCENDDDANGDECNFDTGCDEYQQESLDRHWMVMSATFRTDEEAYDFYNDYAKKCGFCIRRDNLKYVKGVDARRRLRRFLCSRAGKRHAKFCTMEGKKRGLRV